MQFCNTVDQNALQVKQQRKVNKCKYYNMMNYLLSNRIAWSKFQYLTEKKTIPNFVDSAVNTDGVLLIGVGRTPAGTVMTNFKYMKYHEYNAYIYIYGSSLVNLKLCNAVYFYRSTVFLFPLYFQKLCFMNSPPKNNHSYHEWYSLPCYWISCCFTKWSKLVVTRSNFKLD